MDKKEELQKAQGTEMQGMVNESMLKSLREEVASLETMKDLYHADAEQYKKWWLEKQKKLDDIREDLELVEKLFKKIQRTWKI